MPQTFEYLDLAPFRALYCDAQSPLTMKFYVEGIKCSKCISKIENLKIQNQDLQNLEVDLAHQTALVELKALDKSFARVASDIADLGFRPVPLKSSEDATENWKQESRADLIRLGVAGFCAGNIMILAFATYFGLEGPMKTSFEWLQLGLYLPVISYVAWPFYKGFWSSLRQKSLSIDGPMAVASFLGFSVSAWNLFRGTGSIYFDSLSGFLFLILITRYFQKKARLEHLKFLKPSALAESFKARLLEPDGSRKWVRSDDLKINDQISIEQNEWIPADGILISPQAVLDLSILDGESMPRRVHSGFPVKAGSRLLSPSIQVQVTGSGSQTFLGHLLSSTPTAALDETQSSRLSDRASQILLALVLSIAALVLISGFFGDFESQFEKAFALIILACPCAMAFGTPLAFSFSMKRSLEQGIVVKSGRVFEDLQNIRTLFLDKTGTLTERFWNISSSSLSEVPEKFKQVILLLESRSEHPVAFALREIWSDVQIPNEISLEKFSELRSEGVSGSIQGETFEFKHFFKNQEKWFGLFKNEQLIWQFRLQPLLQAGSKDCIDQLKNLGFEIHLLSGDSIQETQKTAEQLGLSSQYAHGEQTPKSKAEIVSHQPHSIMIGDGVNDALALKTAQVGIAVKGGVDIALKSADVLFLQSGVEPFLKLLQSAAKARRQIRRNLISALIYNALGGTAALLGWVDPFVAALLMPTSSLFILASTWWGARL